MAVCVVHCVRARIFARWAEAAARQVRRSSSGVLSAYATRWRRTHFAKWISRWAACNTYFFARYNLSLSKLRVTFCLVFSSLLSTVGGVLDIFTKRGFQLSPFRGSQPPARSTILNSIQHAASGGLMMNFQTAKLALETIESVWKCVLPLARLL